MKIYAPVKDTNGVYATVRFSDGVGNTDNPHLIRWFKEHGYTLEYDLPEVEVLHGNTSFTTKEAAIESITHDEPVEPDFDSMTPNELRDWMRVNGLGREMKNIRNKEKLIEIINSKKG